MTFSLSRRPYTPMPARAWAALLKLLGSSCSAVQLSAIRIASATLHPFEIALFRNLVGFLVILPFLGRLGQHALRRRQRMRSCRGWRAKRRPEACEALDGFADRLGDLWRRELPPIVERGLQMMPCFLRSACSSPDTQPKTFGSPSSFWTK
jgi:hypothetical protein